MVFCKTLIFGILIASGLLPVTAKYELPRPRINTKNVRTIKYSDYPNLSKYPHREMRSLEEDYDGNYPYRRDQQIYVITLDSKQLLKKIEKLPLQNNEESYESKLPLKKIIPMLPLANYEDSDDKNDINIQNRIQIQNRDQLAKLFDKNGMLYLTRPKNIVKSSLRNDDTDTPGWDALNRILNRGLEQKMKESAPEPQSYKFSDLVL